jgi:hypothetical protein
MIAAGICNASADLRENAEGKITAWTEEHV